MSAGRPVSKKAKPEPFAIRGLGGVRFSPEARKALKEIDPALPHILD